MSWLVSTRQYIPAVIGEAWGGGYFAGYISHTADGNPTHALIVASRQEIGGKYAVSGVGYTGSTTNRAWAAGTAASNAVTTGVSAGATLTAYNARKDFDGAVTVAVMKENSYSLSDATYPAAYFIDNINASGGFNGYSDWYLPSRYELDIAYFNLKPSTALNTITGTIGQNIYAVPQRNTNYTTTYPAQTMLTAFSTTAETFVADGHWSSTENGAALAWNFFFSSGNQASTSKSSPTRVRAFRKIAL